MPRSIVDIGHFLSWGGLVVSLAAVGLVIFLA